MCKVDKVKRAKDDLMLLARMLDGEVTAWSDFQKSYQPLIAACVRRVLRKYDARCNYSDIEDFIADVWLQLLKDDSRKLRTYDPKRGVRLSSWIGLITTNHVIDRLRRQRNDVYLEDPSILVDRFASNGGCPQAAAERRQSFELTRTALELLPVADRRFLIDCCWNERPPAELAAELGVAVSTIYSRKFKVRHKLERIMVKVEKQRFAA